MEDNNNINRPEIQKPSRLTLKVLNSGDVISGTGENEGVFEKLSSNFDTINSTGFEQHSTYVKNIASSLQNVIYTGNTADLTDTDSPNRFVAPAEKNWYDKYPKMGLSYEGEGEERQLKITNITGPGEAEDITAAFKADFDTKFISQLTNDGDDISKSEQYMYVRDIITFTKNDYDSATTVTWYDNGAGYYNKKIIINLPCVTSLPTSLNELGIISEQSSHKLWPAETTAIELYVPEVTLSQAYARSTAINFSRVSETRLVYSNITQSLGTETIYTKYGTLTPQLVLYCHVDAQSDIPVSSLIETITLTIGKIVNSNQYYSRYIRSISADETEITVTNRSQCEITLNKVDTGEVISSMYLTNANSNLGISVSGLINNNTIRLTFSKLAEATAGTYDVYFYIGANKNYNESNVIKIEVTIE